MTKYHATFIDETGCDYGITMDVDDGVENVSEYFREMYPEMQLQLVEPAHGASTSRAQADAVWLERWENDTWDLY